jgi:hypothetical protein
MWSHGTVAELLGEAGLCRCARMPDAAYVQVTDCYWREADLQRKADVGAAKDSVTIKAGRFDQLGRTKDGRPKLACLTKSTGGQR